MSLNIICNLKLEKKLQMENDLIPFLAGIVILVVYLVFSAWTEMGTKNPWKK